MWKREKKNKKESKLRREIERVNFSVASAALQRIHTALIERIKYLKTLPTRCRHLFM